jgi:hypothetical protein
MSVSIWLLVVIAAETGLALNIIPAAPNDKAAAPIPAVFMKSRRLIPS